MTWGEAGGHIVISISHSDPLLCPRLLYSAMVNVPVFGSRFMIGNKTESEKMSQSLVKVPKQLQLQTGNLNATEILITHRTAREMSQIESPVSSELLEIFLIPDIRSISDQYTSFYIN